MHDIRSVAKQVVRAFSLAATFIASDEEGPAVREITLLTDRVWWIVPARLLDLGDDELPQVSGSFSVNRSPNQDRQPPASNSAGCALLRCILPIAHAT